MLNMQTRPSELIGIEDAYTAFCFDEACAFIISELQDKKEPIIQTGKDKNNQNKHYSKPSDIYKKYEK